MESLCHEVHGADGWVGVKLGHYQRHADLFSRFFPVEREKTSEKCLFQAVTPELFYFPEWEYMCTVVLFIIIRVHFQ